MGLETVEFITDLNPAWPNGTDKVRYGDDHIRRIKTALKNSFPNINAPVTATPEQLNGVPVGLMTILADIVSHLPKARFIQEFAGAIEDIPDGWVLCDGNNGTPDLTDKFVLGAGNSVDPDDEGGATSKTTDSKTPAVTVGDTALSTAHLPAHRHFVAANVVDTVGTAPAADNQVARETTAGGDTEYNMRGTATDATVGRTSSVGEGAAHGHSALQAAHTHDVNVMPPWYALAYIMKTTTYELPEV
jgi:microcystin-dependent protein